MEIQEKIDNLFQELKFEEKVLVNGTPLLLYGGTYYKITFVKGLRSFVIEFANSYDEASNTVFEDGDLYPISLKEDELIDKLRHDILKYYINA